MDKLIDWLFELAKSKKRPIAVLLIVAAVGLYAYWNWDHVKELPGIAQIRDVIAHHRSLPTPDKSKLSIGIVHLNGDDDGRFATDIVEDLNDIPPVQVKTLDRPTATVRLRFDHLGNDLERRW